MAGNKAWGLRPAAEADLTAIWRHSAVTWGPQQADSYVDALFATFDLLADFPQMARVRSEFAPPVRIHPSGTHLVIYQITDQGIDIIRLLHAHQNLFAYLQEN